MTSSVSEKSKSKPGKSRKRSRQADEQDAAEERRLTALLFGGAVPEEPQEELEASESEEEQNEQSVDDEIAENFFELDRTGDENVSVDGDEEQRHERTRESESDDDETDNDKPAWIDEDDEHVSMSLMSADRLKKLRKTRSETAPLDGVELERRLRKRFQDTTTARTDWADIPENDAQKTGDSLLESSAAPLLASSSDRLPAHVLSVVRCPDANQQDPNKAVVQAVHFHPGSDPDRPLMLTAGLDKTLRFFQVGAEDSQKIHGIHCTLSTASFCYAVVSHLTNLFPCVYSSKASYI